MGDGPGVNLREPLARPTDGKPSAKRHLALLAASAVVMVAAGAVIAWATWSRSFGAGVALAWPSLTPTAAMALGLAFWTAMCLVASAYSTPLPDGSVLLFHFAPLLAAITLAGPAGAAWIALVGTLELRELRLLRSGQIPWYGALFNHAVEVLAAVSGATAVGLVRAWLAGGSDQPGLALAAMLAGALAYFLIDTAPHMALIALRTGKQPAILTSSLRDAYLVSQATQALLGWAMATMYVSAAWWTPLILLLFLVSNQQAFELTLIELLVHRDHLTGLGNSREYEERLVQAQAWVRRGDVWVVMYFDLDHFKAINDKYSHTVGDEVLKIVAQRLRELLREVDVKIRLHGDEFAVIAQVTDEAGAHTLAWRLHDSICLPMEVGPDTLSVGASIGVAFVRGDGEPMQITQAADAAMYRAKETHAGVLFESDMAKAA